MLPAKYTNLVIAANAGVTTPSVLFLSETELKEKTYSDSLAAFLDAFPNQQTFIVRSAVADEDGTSRANAGFFFSSNETMRKKLSEAIEYAYAENTKRVFRLKRGGTVNLMVSPFIRSKIGGVAFSPWLYFFNHALVSFANTPQDAVLGLNTEKMLLAHEAGPPYPEKWKNLLATTIGQLHKVFRFPFDIEWAYDGHKLWILQVRPITIPPTGFKHCPLETLTTKKCVAIDQYGRALGKLSPLSFELICYLYEHATYYWESLVITGGNSFFERLQNGEIATNQTYFDAYIRDRHWYSAFSRQVKARTVLKKLNVEAEAWGVATNTFSLERTLVAFSRWQTAAALERLCRVPPSTPAFPFEYELLNGEKYVYGTRSVTARWKEHFMHSLHALKAQVQKDPQLAWSTLTDVLRGHVSPDWERSYEQELEVSVFVAEQSFSFEAGVGINSFSKEEIFIIERPETWSGPLPKDKIIRAPYIPQSWIMELPYLKGVAVEHLDPLSHAAIVLRENNVLLQN